MGSLNPLKMLSKPKVAAPVVPEPVNTTASAEDIAANQEKERLRRASQLGRASTILTSESNSKQLLG